MEKECSSSCTDNIGTTNICLKYTKGNEENVKFTNQLMTLLKSVQYDRKRIKKEIDDEEKKCKDILKYVKQLERINGRYRNKSERTFELIFHQKELKKNLEWEIKTLKSYDFRKQETATLIPRGIFCLNILTLNPECCHPRQNLMTLRHLIKKENVLKTNIDKIYDDIAKVRRNKASTEKPDTPNYEESLLIGETLRDEIEGKVTTDLKRKDSSLDPVIPIPKKSSLVTITPSWDD